jgi:hypothetical protein
VGAARGGGGDETFPVASAARGDGITGEKKCSREGVFAKKMFNGLGCWGPSNLGRREY